jgi:hypothetical protein
MGWVKAPLKGRRMVLGSSAKAKVKVKAKEMAMV